MDAEVGANALFSRGSCSGDLIDNHVYAAATRSLQAAWWLCVPAAVARHRRHDTIMQAAVLVLMIVVTALSFFAAEQVHEGVGVKWFA